MVYIENLQGLFNIQSNELCNIQSFSPLIVLVPTNFPHLVLLAIVTTNSTYPYNLPPNNIHYDNNGSHVIY